MSTPAEKLTEEQITDLVERAHVYADHYNDRLGICLMLLLKAQHRAIWEQIQGTELDTSVSDDRLPALYKGLAATAISVR